MPINSYIQPLLQQPAASAPQQPQLPPPAAVAGGSSLEVPSNESIRPPGMQRLNSLSSLNSNDRRRRGSSFGNLFSSLASSLRQQSDLTRQPLQTTLPPLNNQSSNPVLITPPPPSMDPNPFTLSASSSYNPMGHEPSSAITMRPSFGESRRGSAVAASSQSLGLLMSPTVTDIHQLNNTSTRSSSSLRRESTSGPDILEHDELMDEVDELLEETEEQARTRQNSTAIVPAMAESVVDKRESDGSFSIRLTPFIDHSSSSPALYFSPLIRKLKPGMRLPIGRYTERNREAAQAPHGSSAAVVFKSKVVSRTHLEILVDEHGNWYIRDLKSSSGTFLNHIRLSPAGVESDDCMVCDGDILQLGMDFRGGSEEIFRCVKVRVELNKSWKRKTHRFNKETHKKLLGEETECCICLNDLKVGDSIFISPCSHSWHYKCIRPLLVKNYPQFHCPNCRSITDLEEDDDDDD